MNSLNLGENDMNKLTVVANVVAKEDKIELVKSELLKLIKPTLAEEGCIQYDLHQDNDNPAHFIFIENWESRDLWQAHMNSAHLQACMAATDGAFEELTVKELTQISTL